MGRPPSLSDRFIDADLPLDVDEDTRDLGVYQRAAKQDRSRPARPQTTMSCFIHLVRLKRIESDIQHTIYRVDSPACPKDVCEATDMFLTQLQAWKDAIPVECTQNEALDLESFEGNDYRRYDNYVRALCFKRLSLDSSTDRCLLDGIIPQGNPHITTTSSVRKRNQSAVSRLMCGSMQICLSSLQAPPHQNSPGVLFGVSSDGIPCGADTGLLHVARFYAHQYLQECRISHRLQYYPICDDGEVACLQEVQRSL